MTTGDITRTPQHELLATAHHLTHTLQAAAPGASTIAVALHHEGSRALAVHGHTGHHHGQPADESTRFEIGSLTKTFTALLLAEQAARGELSHRDPLALHLPTPSPGGDAVTLTHLATHTSGLPRLPPGLLPRAGHRLLSNPYADYATEDVLRQLARTRLRSTPGTRVRYSNFGVGILGHALTTAADGNPYSALLASRVLEPLALHDTDCETTPPPSATQATGYWHGRPRPLFRIPGLPAAGALRASARDLLALTEALLDPTATALPAPLITALRDVLRPRLRLPRGDGLALVWNVRRRTDGTVLYHHSGATPGFTAFTGFSPHHRTALVALANTGPTRGNSLIQQAYTALISLHHQ